MPQLNGNTLPAQSTALVNDMQNLNIASGPPSSTAYMQLASTTQSQSNAGPGVRSHQLVGSNQAIRASVPELASVGREPYGNGDADVVYPSAEHCPSHPLATWSSAVSRDHDVWTPFQSYPDLATVPEGEELADGEQDVDVEAGHDLSLDYYDFRN